MARQCEICGSNILGDRPECEKCWKAYQNDLAQNRIPKAFVSKEDFFFGTWRMIRLALMSEARGEISHEDVKKKIENSAKAAAERREKQAIEQAAEQKRQKEASRIAALGRNSYPEDIY